MDKRNESMRERLLARLPQPENLAAYREKRRPCCKAREGNFLGEKFPARVLMWLRLRLYGGQFLLGAEARHKWTHRL